MGPTYPHKKGATIEWGKICTHIYVLRCALVSIGVQKKKPPGLEAFSLITESYREVGPQGLEPRTNRL